MLIHYMASNSHKKSIHDLLANTDSREIVSTYKGQLKSSYAD